MKDASALELRVLLFTPTGRDASLACNLLHQHFIRCLACDDLAMVCEQLDQGVGALVMAEETLSPAAFERLTAHLHRQEPWSDLPVLILTTAASLRTSPAVLEEMLNVLGNVTLLERPIRVATLVTALRTALRARQRQYIARESLRAMAEQEASLKLADQRKDEFLAMLAHELRNPMSAISTALTLMEKSPGDAVRVDRYRGTARRQMTNLTRLVDDLLDVSRITRGMVELRREPMELEKAAQNAVSAARPTIEERKHRLTLAIEPGAYRLSADATRVEQIIANLLSNAAKYTPPGGCIDVRLSQEHLEGRPYALLCVQDNGRGVPEEMLANIFALFVQVEPGLDRTTGGLGLGLTLVKQLAELHGGTVLARSAGRGQGSTFEVRLPLSEQETVLLAAESSVVSSPPRRIVLVEDNEDLRDCMGELLTELGHQVTVAVDGIDGIAKIIALEPDIAFVDVGLPGFDGYEVARQVRAHEPACRSLLVSLTGYSGEEARAHSLAAGFDRYLTKPFNVEDLPGLLEATPLSH